MLSFHWLLIFSESYRAVNTVQFTTYKAILRATCGRHFFKCKGLFSEGVFHHDGFFLLHIPHTPPSEGKTLQKNHFKVLTMPWVSRNRVPRLWNRIPCLRNRVLGPRNRIFGPLDVITNTLNSGKKSCTSGIIFSMRLCISGMARFAYIDRRAWAEAKWAEFNTEEDRLGISNPKPVQRCRSLRYERNREMIEAVRCLADHEDRMDLRHYNWLESDLYSTS